MKEGRRVIKIVAAGYVCIDYYPELGNRYYVTGNGVDVLFNILKLRENKKDVESAIVSAVSDDTYGMQCIKEFEERNIDISKLLVITGGKTPSVPVFLKNHDRIHGIPNRGVMKDFEFSDEIIDYITQFDIMHSDFTGKLIPHFEKIRKHGTKIFFDLSTSRNHPLAETVLKNIDYGLTSFEDNIEDAKRYISYAVSQGVKVMIATLGVNGSIAFDGKKFYREQIVPAENVVNTVGAGDSYFAGYISGWIDNKSIEECMAMGSSLSSKVVSVFNPYL